MDYKITYVIFGFFLASFVATPAHSQGGNVSQNSLALSWGLRYGQSQDQIFSPLIYDGQSLSALKVFYQRRTQNTMHLASIAFDRISVKSAGSLTFPFFGSSVSRQSSTAWFLNYKYAYAREIMSKGKVDLLLGGILDNQIHVVQYRLAQFEDEGHLLAYSLGILLRGEYQLTQTQSFNLETSVPLLSYVSRPAFAIVDNERIQSDTAYFFYIHEDGNFEVLNFLKLNLLLNYRRQVSRRFDMQLSYQFEYLRYTEPTKISVARNSFDIGLVFKF